MKIIEYKIVEANGADALAEEVNIYIREGWQPHGSLTVTSIEKHPSSKGFTEYVFVYTQAIVLLGFKKTFS
jgi:hypothetical protein